MSPTALPRVAGEIVYPESDGLPMAENTIQFRWIFVLYANLAALFGAFVFVQVRYLFGGHDLVERTTGLTYAEYARRGFFELVVVAALLLPVLAVMDWARQKTRGSARVYVVLATVLVALMGVVMVSAAERLRIY